MTRDAGRTSVRLSIETSPPEPVMALARAIADAGGRILVVGGWVRDALRGVPSKDLDLEVYGLGRDATSRILAPFGFTPPVGRSFPVWRHMRDGIDVALPRLGDAERWKGEATSLDPVVAEAARGRDLTVNAIAWDPLAGRLIDPLGGATDLRRGTLRMADAAGFGRDPLRVLRVARLASALDAVPDDALGRTCASMDLTVLPVERVFAELRRVLLELARPWSAFEWLDRLGQLGVVAPVEALKGVAQDPTWHPEGDVFVHTGLVVDRAAQIARPLDPASAETLMWSALCHDFGKPATTSIVEDGRVRNPGHEGESARVARGWLEDLRCSRQLVEAVVALVERHLAPASFVAQGAGPRGYRRLARRLAEADVTVVDLERLARADHLGRATKEALAGRFPAGEVFLLAARDVGVEGGASPDVVSASTLMQDGVPAGPELGRLLARCREIQDESGWADEARIVARVRAERAREEGV